MSPMSIKPIAQSTTLSGEKYNQKELESVVNALPAYLRIYRAMHHDIVSRKFLSNEKLPSETELCKLYDVSRHTIRHAFQKLVDDGLVIRRQGRASYVRPLQDVTEEETITLTFGCLNQPSILLTQFFEKFARRVEEESQGLIHIEVHHSSAFGSGNEHIAKVASGEIDMFGGAIDWLANLDSSFAVSTFPFLYSDIDHVERASSHPLFHNIRKNFVEKSGVRILSGNWFRPSRIVLSRKPLLSCDDIKGLTMGIPSISLYEKVWQCLGVNTVHVNFGERREAFLSGKIDATDVNWDIILSEDLCDVAPYALTTHHLYSRAGIVISEKKFQSFRSDLQQSIVQIAEDLGKEYSNYLLERHVDSKKAMIAKNMCFVECNTLPMQNATQTLFEKLGHENKWPVSLYSQIKNL